MLVLMNFLIRLGIIQNNLPDESIYNNILESNPCPYKKSFIVNFFHKMGIINFETVSQPVSKDARVSLPVLPPSPIISNNTNNAHITVPTLSLSLVSEKDKSPSNRLKLVKVKRLIRELIDSNSVLVKKSLSLDNKVVKLGEINKLLQDVIDTT